MWRVRQWAPEARHLRAGVVSYSKLLGEFYPMVEEADHLQLTRLARLLRKKNISCGQATELAELIS